ncbi:MAG: hypothetical protein AAB416_05080 [Patescibacteria group bacterium]
MSKTVSPLPWILAIVFGVLGALLSAGLFLVLLLMTGSVFGILVAAFGVLAGLATAVGFKLGKGSLATSREVTLFLSLVTIFGFLGVAAGYGVLMGFAWFGGDITPWSVLEPLDLLFAFLGALGGRWAGEKFLLHFVHKHEAAKLEEPGAVSSLDSKFSRKSPSQEPPTYNL